MSFTQENEPLHRVKGWINFDESVMPAKVLYDMVFNNVRLIFDQVVDTEQSRRLSSMLVDFMERGAHEAIVDALSPKDDRFNVIAHADCWSNNMLFRGEKCVLNFVDRRCSMLYFSGRHFSEPSQHQNEPQDT